MTGLGGRSDGNLLSLSIAPGVSLSLEFSHGPELDLDLSLIARAKEMIATDGSTTIPFDFEGLLNK